MTSKRAVAIAFLFSVGERMGMVVGPTVKQEILTFPHQSLEEAFALEFIDDAFIEVPTEIHIDFDRGVALRDDFQRIAQSFLGDARRHRKTSRKVVVCFLESFGVFEAQALGQDRYSFFSTGHELVSAFGIGLLEALHYIAVLLDKGTARDHDIHRKGGSFYIRHFYKFVHAKTQRFVDVGIR